MIRYKTVLRICIVCIAIISTHVLAKKLHAEVEVIDANGEAILIGDSSRIVSIGGIITEIIYALDADERLVGTDTTSIWSQTTLDMPDVGGHHDLSLDDILSVSPTLVIATEDAGPDSVMQKLRDSGITLLILPAVNGIPGRTLYTLRVSQSLGLKDRGIDLIRRFCEKTASLETSL